MKKVPLPKKRLVSDISDVAEYILTNHPEIDFLMLCGMPRSISFRTQKQLPISLAYVAKYMTGSGGGHPQASGAVLTAGQFKDMFTSNLNILSGGSVGIHNLGLYSQQDPHKRGCCFLYSGMRPGAPAQAWLARDHKSGGASPVS